MDLYAPLSTEKKPPVSRDVGEISTNDAPFHEQAATAVAATACLGSATWFCCHVKVVNRKHS
jgi:hypothetical protein